MKVFVKSMREHNWAFTNNWFQNKPRPFFDRMSTALFFFLFFLPPFFTTATASELRVWHALLILLSANASASRIVGGCSFFSQSVCVTCSLRARFIIPAEYSCFPRSRLFPLCIYPGRFFYLRISANTLATENYSFDSIFPFLRPSRFFRSIIDILTTLTICRFLTIIHLEFI